MTTQTTCPNCQRAVEEESAYCPGCGTELRTASGAHPPADADAAPTVVDGSEAPVATPPGAAPYTSGSRAGPGAAAEQPTSEQDAVVQPPPPVQPPPTQPRQPHAPPPGYQHPGYQQPPGYPPAPGNGYPPQGAYMGPVPLAGGYVGPPAPPGYPPAGPEQHDGGGGRRGLIAGLIVAVCLAVLGGAAAILVATTGRQDVKTVSVTKAASVNVNKLPHIRVPKPHLKGNPQASAGSTPSTPVPASGNAPSVNDAAAVDQMLNQHFTNIRDGNYSTAWNDFTSHEQGNLGSEGGQIASWRNDGLASFSLSTTTNVSGSSGTASINDFSVNDATGCHAFSGSWGVVKSGGRWFIDSVSLTERGC